MTYEEMFSKNNVTINLAKYEMYYQVSLGSLISDSKSKDIDPSIELQYALGSIYELITQIISDEKADEIFEIELQKQASMDALQTFVNENLNIVKDGTIKVEQIVNAINDGIFFHESMIEVCNENLENQLVKWNELISEDLAQKIYDSVLELQKENRQ